MRDLRYKKLIEYLQADCNNWRRWLNSVFFLAYAVQCGRFY